MAPRAWRGCSAPAGTGPAGSWGSGRSGRPAGGRPGRPAAAAGDAEHDPLHALAIECLADPATPVLARTPGLPDGAYESDGALTKWPVRAVTLAALAPTPGALLWDVGAGSG